MFKGTLCILILTNQIMNGVPQLVHAVPLIHLCVRGEWCVACHEVVETRGGDEGRYQTNQIVVHVPGVTQGGSACRHYHGHL